MCIQVVVPHVVLLEVQPELALEVVMVDGIVGHVIKQIPTQKADEEGSDVNRSDHQPEQPEKECSQRYTDGRNHDQSFAIARIIVVYSMENEVDPFSPFTGRTPMKDKAVQNVFRQGPDE